MRLWDKNMIGFLPRQQLLSQWRECVCIAKNLNERGTPNHILVNPILDYPRQDFIDYCNIVLVEMVKRGYNVTQASINKLEDYIDFNVDSELNYCIFMRWHDMTYLKICYANLMEKWLRDGITNKEWQVLIDGYKEIAGEDYVV